MKRLATALLGSLLAGCQGGRACSPAAQPPPVPVSRAWLDGELPEQAKQGSPRRGGVLQVRVPIEPAGLNWLHDQMAEGWSVKYTSGTVYETLAELDRSTHPEYRLKPLLAESWSESEDRLALTVTLRQGVRFHNGEPCTAHDLKAVMDTVMNPQNLSAVARGYFSELAGYEVLDAQRFRVRWKRPYFLAHRHFLTAVPLMPASALEGRFNQLPINRAPVGTGPFRFVSWMDGAITFARFDGYWGAAPYLDGYVVRIVKDHTLAAQLWESGAFDLMTQVPPAMWRALESPEPGHQWAQRGYHRIRFPENFYSWIGWNHQRPLFADGRVRRALSMLYPTEKVFRWVDLGLEPPTTCPYYRESSSCDPTVERLPNDPAAAKKLLAEAGWTDSDGDGVLDRQGVRFSFRFLSNPHSLKLAKLLPLLQEAFKDVGIEMTIEPVETAVFFQRLRAHDFDAASLGWANRDRAQDNHQVFHSSQIDGGSNYVGYRSEEADQLLEGIRGELDPERREALERQLHRRVYSDQVYTFMSNRMTLDAVKRQVKGLQPALNWYDLRQVWLEPAGAGERSNP